MTKSEIRDKEICLLIIIIIFELQTAEINFENC